MSLINDIKNIYSLRITDNNTAYHSAIAGIKQAALYGRKTFILGNNTELNADIAETLRNNGFVTVYDAKLDKWIIGGWDDTGYKIIGQLGEDINFN